MLQVLEREKDLKGDLFKREHQGGSLFHVTYSADAEGKCAWHASAERLQRERSQRSSVQWAV